MLDLLTWNVAFSLKKKNIEARKCKKWTRIRPNLSNPYLTTLPISHPFSKSTEAEPFRQHKVPRQNWFLQIYHSKTLPPTPSSSLPSTLERKGRHLYPSSLAASNLYSSLSLKVSSNMWIFEGLIMALKFWGLNFCFLIFSSIAIVRSKGGFFFFHFFS